MASSPTAQHPLPFPESTDAINAIAREMAAAIRTGAADAATVRCLGRELSRINGLPDQWAWLLVADLAAMLKHGTATTLATLAPDGGAGMSNAPATLGFSTPGVAMTRNDYLGLAHLFTLAQQGKPAAGDLRMVVLTPADLAMLAQMMQAKAAEVPA